MLKIGKTMVRRIIAIVTGLMVGVICIYIIEGISVIMYSPEALDYDDPEAIKEHINNLPLAAFVFVLVAHAVGAFAAGVAGGIAHLRPWRMGAVIIGAILLAGGVANLIAIPHPWWFMIVDVTLYLPSAILGEFLVTRMITPKFK